MAAYAYHLSSPPLPPSPQCLLTFITSPLPTMLAYPHHRSPPHHGCLPSPPLPPSLTTLPAYPHHLSPPHNGCLPLPPVLTTPPSLPYFVQTLQQAFRVLAFLACMLHDLAKTVDQKGQHNCESTPHQCCKVHKQQYSACVLEEGSTLSQLMGKAPNACRHLPTEDFPDAILPVSPRR